MPTTKKPNAATTIDTITSLATPSAPLPAISADASRISRRITSGTMIALSANDTAARTYNSGMPRPLATTTASTLTASDCAAYSRIWARNKAARSIPNSSSNTTTATVLAVPSNTDGTVPLGVAVAASSMVVVISHPRGRG